MIALRVEWFCSIEKVFFPFVLFFICACQNVYIFWNHMHTEKCNSYSNYMNTLLDYQLRFIWIEYKITLRHFQKKKNKTNFVWLKIWIIINHNELPGITKKHHKYFLQFYGSNVNHFMLSSVSMWTKSNSWAWRAWLQMEYLARNSDSTASTIKVVWTVYS